jgi:hypothetical protein
VWIALKLYLPILSVTVEKGVFTNFTETPEMGFWVFLSITQPDKLPFDCPKAIETQKNRQKLNKIPFIK